MTDTSYDFVIIGAGGTGLAAAMYAGRLGLKTICFGTMSTTELPVGGVITLTDTVENYPGYVHLTGTELAQKLEEHARQYDVEIETEKVTAVEKATDGFSVTTEKRTVSAKTILFATGSKWRKLEVPGAVEFENRGVSYCALCDGPLFKNKTVAVVGGSDSAAKEALFLAEHASRVYIIYRGEQIRPEPINQKLIDTNEKIVVINKTNITEIVGEGIVKSVTLDQPYSDSTTLELNGVFVAIGHIPLSELATNIGVACNTSGEIIIDRQSQTNVPGVFAAGDVVDTVFKQSITGVAEGVHAAYSAFTYIKKREATS